jgi:cysteinyl-tRNA synthetase
VDEVANVDDPMKAWQDMIEQFQKAGLGWNAPDFLQTMFAPMQQQLSLLQEAFETQAEFNRKLTQQVLAPMRQVLEGLRQAGKTTRAAGEALKEAGELLTQQAAAMDQALSFTSPFFETTGAPSEGTAKVADRVSEP